MSYDLAALEEEFGPLIPVGQGRMVRVDTARLAQLAARHEQPDGGARPTPTPPSGHHPAVGRRESTTADEAPPGRAVARPGGADPQTTAPVRGRRAPSGGRGR